MKVAQTADKVIANGINAIKAKNSNDRNAALVGMAKTVADAGKDAIGKAVSSKISGQNTVSGSDDIKGKVAEASQDQITGMVDKAADGTYKDPKALAADVALPASNIPQAILK